MSATYITENGVTKKIQKLYDVENGLTKKIKKLYKVENGVTNKIFEEMEVIGYTGDYTVTDVMVGTAPYKLYTLTSSGTLTLLAGGKYWICGGGSGGLTSLNGRFAGGGGAGGYTKTGNIAIGSYVITIGAGGAANKAGSVTKISNNSGTVLYSAEGGKTVSTITIDTVINGCSGGTGGGAGTKCYFANSGNDTSGVGTVGAGDGGSKYPFELTALEPHCAGGAGGSANLTNNLGSTTLGKGGTGGTNGANGGKATSYSSTSASSNGGNKGGGKGGAGAKSGRNGSAATFYGSAGGGAGAHLYYDKSAADYVAANGTGGKGYQGVLYLLIPAA